MKNALLKEIALSEAGLIFNPVTGESFTVNPIGISILNLLKQGKDLDTICQLLLEEYNVEAAIVERDVMDFISLLKQFQLTGQDEKEN
ncbi:MAG: PqqD family protein [Bacteroidales bacterium]|nr:PqqD family protein [Bacteroidales bacterium]MBK7173957.1 PqqD family protein [Bacteroidales bacterium]